MRLFISYKTGTSGLSTTANFLRTAFEASGFTVWMDTEDMQAGYNWNDQIYDEIPRCDVLVLVLAAETKQSRWVQREVDIARASRVKILPVVIESDFTLQETLDHFDIPRLQVIFFTQGTSDETNRLINYVNKLKGDTRRSQLDLFSEILELSDEESKKLPLPNNQRYKMYSTSGWQGKLYLATGDITELREVDVLVNPENSFMQMARIFETQSVSAKVRLKGSRVLAGTVREDTVQQELLEQVKYHEDYDLPVGPGYIIPTSAGHSKSRLVQNGVRYLFHISTTGVHVGASDEHLIPIDDAQIRLAVRNTFDQISIINSTQGVFFAVDRPEYEHQMRNRDSYNPIKSIAYPLFATGRGGRESNDDVLNVVDTILRTVEAQLRRSQTTLEEIYINAYAESDLEVVETIMDEMFGV